VKKIKIGQIGIGHNHGAEKMAALVRLNDIFEVVGVVENDPEWRKKRGSNEVYQGIPFMSEEELFAIPDLDAVAVETDGFDLCPTALRCAERGVHIHMDKPGGEDLAAFKKLLEICKEKSLVFQQAYIYRYNPAVRFCMEAVRNKWLGEIFEIHAVMSRYDGDNPEYRKWLSQFKGGAMYIFAGYLIDLVISMLGAPDKVTPFMKKTRNEPLVDNGLAVLEYAKATATVRVSVEEVEGYKYRHLIVCGTEGSIEICPIEFINYYTDKLSARLTLKHPKGPYSAGTHIVDCGLLNCRYGAQLTEFAKIIREEMKNPFPPEHEFLLHETLLKACDCI
jgi:predicted dehydrogenase